MHTHTQRERERERDIERQIERDTHREAERERHIERDRERETHRERERERQRGPLAFGNDYLIERCRFSGNGLRYLCSHALTVPQMVCVTLRFFASGSFLYSFLFIWQSFVLVG